MKRLTRSQAIKAKCLECCCGDRKEVRLCTITHCPLWSYRLGKEIDMTNTSDIPNLGVKTPQNHIKIEHN